MGLQLFCNVVAFVFVLSLTVDYTSAKSTSMVKHAVPMSRIIDDNGSNSILVLTNSSCTENGPLPDPEDPTRFYQCLEITEGPDTYFFMVHWQCATNGVYDPESGACVEMLVSSDPPTTTEILTTPEVTTTEIPTTAPPLAESPITELSTTEPPTTEALTTELSTTEMSTTESPTSGVPTTEPPTSEPPTTEPPTTEPPTTEPSTTEPPTTEPPTTEQSTTEPPTTDPATTEPPTTTELMTSTEIPTTVEITTELTTTTSPPPRCTAEGVFPDPDPRKYHRCILILGKFYFYVFTCPATACFNPTSELCVFNSCPAVTTTTTVAPTTVEPPPVVCTGPGTFPFPSDCKKYYHCVLVVGTWYTYIMTCPPGNYFNTVNLQCVPGECPAAPTTLPPGVTTTVPSVPTTLPPPLSPTTTTLAPAPTTAPPPFTCTTEGTYVHPECTKYYLCRTIAGTLYTYIMTCPAGLFYDATTSVCVAGTCSAPTTVTAAPPPPTTTQLVTTTTPAPTTTIPPGLPTCNADGVHPYPTDCTKYFRCLQVTGTWYVYIFTCPMGSYFSTTVPGCILGTCPVTTPPTLPPTTTDVVTTDAATTESGTTDGATTDAVTTDATSDVSSSATSPITTDTTDPSASTIEISTTEVSGSTGTEISTSEISASTVTEISTTGESVSTDISTTGETTTEISTTGASLSTELSTTGDSTTTDFVSTTVVTTTDVTTEETTTIVTTTPDGVFAEFDPTAEPPETTTTPAPFVCTTAGSFPNPENCQKYFSCTLINGKLYKYLNTCPASMHYDPIKNLCTAGTC